MRDAGPAPSSSIAIDDALERTWRDQYEAGFKPGDKYFFGREHRLPNKKARR
jgi:hypothetical protein